MPVYAAWDFQYLIDGTGKCYSTETYEMIAMINGTANIVTDFVFATLPLPLIIPLQMNPRKKISLIGVLSLGYFACAAAIVKCHLLSAFFSDADYSYNDSYMVWNDIELNAGILAACLPTLRPLFSCIFETTATMISQLSGSHGHSASQNHFYDQETRDMKLESVDSFSILTHPYGYWMADAADADLERGYKKANGPKSRLSKSIAEDYKEAVPETRDHSTPKEGITITVTNRSTTP
ncbi:hypothetical protein BP5796_04032 [Coleophoma crateriformis]|uniref:Rhodopsin domain-containing protein n=1 Tax=Coleophoma crateriformis TaxID=565419 RepID=A0A3D8SH84_9HELO|nr:hypothetical protein BP5796_04032 [Coleophoma crateriformis]